MLKDDVILMHDKGPYYSQNTKIVAKFPAGLNKLVLRSVKGLSRLVDYVTK